MEIRPDRVHVAPHDRPDDDDRERKPDERRFVRGSIEFDLFSSFAFSLARFALLGAIIAGIIGAGGVAVWVIRGAKPVHEAARNMATAEDRWFASLTQSQPIIRELTVLGAPREELETVYFAYIDSPRIYKAETGDVLLQVMQDQVVAVRGLGQAVDPVLDLLQPVMRARLGATEAYKAWLRAADQPSAQMAILFGLASRPGERLVQYEEMPKMIRSVSGNAPPH